MKVMNVRGQCEECVKGEWERDMKCEECERERECEVRSV